MALVTCPDCGRTLSDEAPRCLGCGAANRSVAHDERRGSRASWIILAVVLALVAVAVFAVR